MICVVRRVVGAVLVLVALTLGLCAPASAQSTASTPVTVQLLSQAATVGPGQDFTMSVQLVGAREGDMVRATTWAAPNKIADRRQLRAALDVSNPVDTGLVRLRQEYRADVDSTTGLATIHVPEQIDTVRPGVYPVTVSVKRAGQAWSDPLLTTTLVRTGPPTSSAKPLEVALLLPVRGQLAHQSDGTISLSDDERQRLQHTAQAFTGGLGSLPLTVEPTPETIGALAAGSPDDAALLQQLKQLVTGRRLLASSYVPVDEEALRRRGLDIMVGDLHQAGLNTLTGLLGTPDDSGIVRTDPTDTPDTLALRETYGAGRLVVGEDNLQPLDQRRFPPTLLQSFLLQDASGTPMRAIASDDYLTRLAAELDDDGRENDRALLAQRFIGDLFAAYYDDPSLQRGTAIVLPSDWDASAAHAEALFTELARHTELHFTTVDTLFSTVTAAATTGNGRAETSTSGALVRALRPTEAVDLRAYATQLQETTRKLRGFESVTGAPDGPQSADLQLQRLVSADERLDESDRRDYLDGLSQRIDQRLHAADGGPALVGPGTQRVTMTSRTATIPIQIENRLDFAVNVRIELQSDKLDFPEGWLRTPTLAPGPNTIEVPVESKTSGDSILKVAVLPRDTDADLGMLAEGTFTVRSTALSGLGLIISIVALSVLLAWWARHVMRTRRARRLAAREHHPTAADPLTELADSTVPADNPATADETASTENPQPADTPGPTLTRTET